MSEDTDNLEETDAEETCAICGRHLNSNNRSVSQPDLCKECAGEEQGAPAEDI